MTSVTRLVPARQLRSHTHGLLEAMEKLEELEAEMTCHGLKDEAMSLRTVIADLRWQFQELLDKHHAQGAR